MRRQLLPPPRQGRRLLRQRKWLAGTGPRKGPMTAPGATVTRTVVAAGATTTGTTGGTGEAETTKAKAELEDPREPAGTGTAAGLAEALKAVLKAAQTLQPRAAAEPPAGGAGGTTFQGHGTTAAGGIIAAGAGRAAETGTGTRPGGAVIAPRDLTGPQGSGGMRALRGRLAETKTDGLHGTQACI
mmetsp:Transcript_10486/g.40779  ORF Transcript_10486/g.40779 Transcript_10486/m.40779 type:complete len:186 (-) Transcript_10486:350-907(-)